MSKSQPLIINGVPIPTNYDLYKRTVEAAKNHMTFLSFVQQYQQFNTVGADNLLFQVAYMGSDEEIALVRSAIEELQDVV